MIDTNVLLRLPKFGFDHEGTTQVRNTIETVIVERYNPCLTFQNLAEFWSVAGRSIGSNGFAMDVIQISDQVTQFRKLFKLLPEKPSAIQIWQDLCKRHKITGKRVHDAKLVATALANDVKFVLTFNVKDFEMFEDLSIINPESTSLEMDQ